MDPLLRTEYTGAAHAVNDYVQIRLDYGNRRTSPGYRVSHRLTWICLAHSMGKRGYRPGYSLTSGRPALLAGPGRCHNRRVGDEPAGHHPPYGIDINILQALDELLGVVQLTAIVLVDGEVVGLIDA